MNKLSKREFLKLSLMGVGLLYCNKLLAHTKQFKTVLSKLNAMNDKPWKWSKEVYYYETKGDTVICGVCPHKCVIKAGSSGFCNSKVNYAGKLYSIGYGNPCSLNIDPIEKKPLLHFKPQTKSLSLAVAGCNFKCLNCQNWSISQVGPLDTKNLELWPEQVVGNVKKNDCESISFTYSEPITFYEYMFDIAKLARKSKIASVLVSNGYINEKPLRDLAKYLDAASIDLKAFDEKTYLSLTQGSLSNVLNTLKVLKEENVWLEISTLVVPQWSDDMDAIKRMCEWLVKNDLHHFPLHFLRFSPMYKLAHLPSTPVSVLEKAHKIAKDAGIKYAYIGNVPGNDAENTYCPKCNKMLVERRGFTNISNYIVKGKCKYCNEPIDGVWQ